ncbi:hypothetical protein FJR48_10880 [Sulfurimonas lithotrophica]|uniref:Membrane transport protein MMPL domain-containing protein n=1 Tax=Sulfurimonas lithotrophica TaxID=2590022 RepID=A0A5P8P3G9_9BACT|nr:hypothetical protein [Sulfurimonas lithotrophica]QFR50206.1 hypothetical protein FJR48_10880 [Sulfurimonas lithotrophica]
MKHLNILIFLLLGTITLLNLQNIKISTNFMDALFSKESTEIYQISQKLGSSSDILISTKGFDKKALDKLYKIKEDLLKLKAIDTVKISLLPSKEIREYIAKNYYLLSDFKNKKFSDDEIKNKLQKIYNEISTSVFYTPVDNSDPMGLFSFGKISNERYLKLKEHGYILKATTKIKLSQASKSRELYNQIHSITDKYPNTISFAPFYFLVENSAYIQADATDIITLSSILLLVLYFIILKNIKLFFHTVLALSSSAMLAVLISTSIYDEINIISLVFGISITTISIDYMFHYYFHDEFEAKKFIKQKKVFFGFLTTFGVFLIFSFIDIKLFAELSLFSVVSLASAYIIFSLAFPYLNIKSPHIKQKNTKLQSFNPLIVTTISILMLIYSTLFLEFDSDLKSLDYQNTKLKDISKKFNTSLGADKYQRLLLSASTKEKLLQKYEQVEQKHPSIKGIGNFIYSQNKCQDKLNTLKTYDFIQLNKKINSISTDIGFSNIFKNTYLNIQNTKCEMVLPDDIDFKIIKYQNKFYTLALIEKDDKISSDENLLILNMGEILSKNLDELKNTLLIFTIFSLIFVLGSLFGISKTKILYPLSYILFPVSVVLFTLSFYSQLNIMHMFALVILISIGIDYGIYMLDTSTHSQTTKAIRYAMLSTFAGFGVLIFSSVNSLHSIGYVISVGIMSIFVLLILKGKNENI